MSKKISMRADATVRDPELMAFEVYDLRLWVRSACDRIVSGDEGERLWVALTISKKILKRSDLTV